MIRTDEPAHRGPDHRTDPDDGGGRGEHESAERRRRTPFLKRVLAVAMALYEHDGETNSNAGLYPISRGPWPSNNSEIASLEVHASTPPAIAKPITSVPPRDPRHHGRRHGPSRALDEERAERFLPS